MATIDPCVFSLMEISKQKPPISSSLSSPSIASADEWLQNNRNCVKELKFELNADIQKNILDAKLNLSRKMENLYLELKSFENYGKAAIKEMKTHPDTYMQIALQVAGYRTNGR